ncbi:MAG: CHASE2 domain-containing protein, partial [Bacteroidota bacterium]
GLHGTRADTLLQASLRNVKQVVLGVELFHDPEVPGAYLDSVAVDTFFTNQVKLGFVNFPGDENRTIRWFDPTSTLPGEPIHAFATELVQQYAPAKADILLARNDGFEEIHFLGDRDNFIRFDIQQAIDVIPLVDLKKAVEGKIVLIGYATEDEWLNPLIDRHYTPLNKSYTGKTIPDMYGVVLHANVLRMIIEEEYIVLLPAWITLIINVLFCYFNVLIIYWIYHKFHDAFHGVTRILQIGEAILIFFVLAWLFYFFRIKLQLGWGILALLLAYDVIEFYESWIRERLPVLNRIPDHLELPFGRKTVSTVNSSQNSVVNNSLSGDAG